MQLCADAVTLRAHVCLCGCAGSVTTTLQTRHSNLSSPGSAFSRGPTRTKCIGPPQFGHSGDVSGSCIVNPPQACIKSNGYLAPFAERRRRLILAAPR